MKRERTEVRQQQIANAALKVIAQQGLRRFTAAAIAPAPTAGLSMAPNTVTRRSRPTRPRSSTRMAPMPPSG